MGAGKRHPLLGLVRAEDSASVVGEEAVHSLVGQIWDDELEAPVPPEPDPPPVNIAELAEEQEPGLRTLFRKVISAGLKRLARKLDPDA